MIIADLLLSSPLPMLPASSYPSLQSSVKTYDLSGDSLHALRDRYVRQFGHSGEGLVTVKYLSLVNMVKNVFFQHVQEQKKYSLFTLFVQVSFQEPSSALSVFMTNLNK